MTNYIITVISEDKPGIIAGISKVLYENNMNMEDGSSTILAGEFSTILVVSGYIGLADLRKAFENVSKKLKLSVEIHTIDGKRIKISARERAIITIYAADKVGILYMVSTPLAENGINITDLDTRLVGSEDKPIYIASMEVDIPEGFSFKRLEKMMNDVKEKENLNIAVKRLNGTKL